jgi:NTP pyrophosphatase (non-canonical NTP hydrolase)
MTIGEFQRSIEAVYGRKDAARGLERTFMWFVEEVGELARDLLHRQPPSPQPPPEGRGLPSAGGLQSETPLAREFADVLAWLATLASIAGVDLEAAARAKYGAGCPRCGATPCACVERGSS